MLFNWKSKILSSVVAVAMLFTVCPSITFAAKTYLHERLENKKFAPSVEEVEEKVFKNPEWLSEKDDEGRTPLDIARANGLHEIVTFLTSPKCQIAILGTQIEELRRRNERLEERATDLQSQLAAMPRTSAILSSAYPVGSIYMSINSTDPSTLFGGTWEAIENTFLVAQGSSFTAGSTGGTTTHTHTTNAGTTGGTAITTAQMPAHTHTRGTMEISGALTGGDCSFGTYNCGGIGAFAPSGSHPTYMFARTNWDTYGPNYSGISFAASRNWTGATSSVGSGSAHTHSQVSVETSANNNLPPYMAVYMWKRTA